MSFKHVIFDCDGVLVDSEPLSMRIDHAFLTEHGLNLTIAEVSAMGIGLTFEALMEKVERDFGIVLPKELIAEKDARLLALYEKELQTAPGIEEALARMHLPMSVASNSPAERVEAALRIGGLGQYFGGRITTFEHVAQGKPAPDIYLLAARRARVAPKECLVIEDSVAGVTSAVAAGCHVIGYVGLVHDAEKHAARLKAIGARKVIDRLEDLADLEAVTLSI
jgi:HAD superfamily hydrolase (TIGR01509 family)